MKTNSIFATIIAAVALMVSGCAKENKTSGDSPINFTSDITANGLITRVSGELGNVWDKDDEIGIYMYQSNVADGTNARYLYSGSDGKFSPSDKDLYYPSGGTDVNFIAYYPWLDNLNTTHGNVYPINVADQSKNIDLMFAPVKTQSAGTVKFRFSHQLSRLVFLVTDVANTDMAGMTAVIKGMPTTAKFDLTATSPTVANQDNVAPIPAKLVSVSGKTARVEAIVLPGANINYTVDIKLADGSTAELKMDDKSFVSGKQYKYNVTLNATAETAYVSSESIEGYGDGNEGGENVNAIKTPPQPTEPNHIDITTTFEGVMAAFSLAGSGSATIDWGDGSDKETVNLQTLEITGRDLAAKHKIPHTYATGSGVKTITVTGDNITGIDTGSTGSATAIDLQNMPTIRFVACEREKLTSLDVSSVTSLTHLMCLYNTIASLNVTGCTALVDMNIQDNKYKTIVGLNTLTALTFANASRTLMDAADIRAAFAALPDRTGKSQGSIFFYGAGNADYPQCPGWLAITEDDKKVATDKNWKLK